MDELGDVARYSGQNRLKDLAFVEALGQACLFLHQAGAACPGQGLSLEGERLL